MSLITVTWDHAVNSKAELQNSVTSKNHIATKAHDNILSYYY